MVVLQGSLLSSVNNATFHSRCHCYLSFWIVMRFRPDFILASFNTIGNICFKKGTNRKSIYKTHGGVCLMYLFCVCSEIGSEMTYFIQERVGSKVADNNTNMSNSCHFITVAKKSTSLCFATLFNYWTLILPEKCLPHTSTSSRTRLMTYDCKMTFWFVFLISKLNYYFDLF